VASGDAAVAVIDAARPGDHLTLSVDRGGARKTITATLGTRPA
jgi:S1-C subfamily serine protease